jgi:hypothetical protein
MESILWAEIGSLYNNAKVPLGGRLLRTSLTLDEKWFALGLSTDEGDRFQGFHAENILLIMDEAPGIEPKIYEAAQGILTSRGAKTLLIGNPTSPSGPFFDYFKNPLWKAFHISCYESPAIKEPDKYPALTSLKWIEERKAEWGEASPMFISRVLGQFPTEGSDTLIPLSWCHQAVIRWQKDKEKDRKARSDRVYLGLDVARYGDNKTVLSTYGDGKLLAQRAIQKKSVMDAVQMVVHEAISLGPKLMQVAVDDTGLGGGVTDRLRELGYPVLGMNNAAKPTDQTHFKLSRDEQYWNLRELFRSGEIMIPDNDTLISQLSAIKYKVMPGTNKIMVETKDEMRKRGLKSPDEMDSLVLATWGARRLHSSTSFRRKSTGSEIKQYSDISYY